MAHQLFVLKSKFPVSALKEITNILKEISFDLPREEILAEIEAKSPEYYQWALGVNPAYFLQYQVDSCAILKCNEIVTLVWKPKYIQFPSIIHFPELKEKRLNNFWIEATQSNLIEANKGHLLQFLTNFYGTFFHSDENFQTNLVTYAKHFISKLSKVSYWHCIIEQTGKLSVSNREKQKSFANIRVKGFKDGYDKQIYLFSIKGIKESLFSSVKGKWMQLFSFLAMLLIFISVVNCSSDATEGICQHKDSMAVVGAGIMFALLGMRLTKKKKPIAKAKSL